MAQEFKSIAIVGAGPSGCLCAYFLLKAGLEVTLFDYGTPLRTLLPTGGGRCNFAHAEFDNIELAKNYPRGEKFLYSVFSRFGTQETLDLFESIGISSYTEPDGRIFPTSNSSADVRNKLLSKIHKANFVREKVLFAEPRENAFYLKTNKGEYLFSDVVIAIGGNKKVEGIQHTVHEFKPALVGLNTDVKGLSGVTVKNVYSVDHNISGDILFTHFGISGPLIYKISSIRAQNSFPYVLKFNLLPHKIDLQSDLDKNPHKELKNVLSKYFPQRLAEYIASNYSSVKAHMINGKTRDLITDKINNFKITVTGTNKGEETVTCGGYSLDEINSKTMESKHFRNLYFIGEALDVDGFCGGYNLQNAWSTAFVASEAIVNNV